MLLAQTQGLQVSLFAEIKESLLANEVQGKHEKGLGEGQGAEVIGMGSSDRLGMRAGTPSAGSGKTPIDQEPSVDYVLSFG